MSFHHNYAELKYTSAVHTEGSGVILFTRD